MKRLVLLALIALLIPMCAICEGGDFLSDAERCQTTQRMFNEVDYRALAEAVDSYILNETPGPEDSAYAIRQVLEDAAEAVDAMEEVVDDFDGSRSFTLDGVREIGEDCCVVPGYNAADWLHVQMGFVADDWVFFDRIAISVDGEIVLEEDYDSGETTTDVLHDGSVFEKVSRPIDFIEFDAAQAIHDGQKAVIRFSNTSTGEKIDHILTDQEKSALYHCWQLLRARSALSSLYRETTHGD